MAANKENLVRNSDLTPQERREKASKAGKASVEARRKKKSMKEVLEYMLHNSELKPALKQMLADEGIDENEMNHQMVITRSLIAKAEQGDVQAYNTICAMIGEKPADKLDLSGSLDSKIEIGFIETGIDPASDESEVDVG